MKEDKVSGGVLGVILGDIVGLPVQFLTRETVKKDPVIDIRYFEEDLPKGIFSDDGSLTLCLVDSLVDVGYDTNDIAKRFVKWYLEGYLTAFGEAFDIGGATANAMERLIKGVPPLQAGPKGIRDNGNGSLMRILPAAVYFADLPDSELIDRVCEVSRITHGHPRSLLGCSLYALMVKQLLLGSSPEQCYQNIRDYAAALVKGTEMEAELPHYSRILEGTLPRLLEDDIKSSGYVVDTLEAALWSFLTTSNFREAILKVVNLADDADSTGAVCGGLAGIYYGKQGIPGEWLQTMVKKSVIFPMVERFARIVVRED